MNRTRGLLPDDDSAFSSKAVEKIRKACADLQYLLDQGYPSKSAATFTGNHYQLSARQSLAMTRSTSPTQAVSARKSKELAPDALNGQTVYIDGFNLIITLEVALSDGLLIRANDGTIRDLADLRGSYRILPQTLTAIEFTKDCLHALGVAKAVVLLDTPVSNSGRLKTQFYETEWNLELDVQLDKNPDTVLKTLPYVISADSVILDHCISWFNMVSYIITRSEPFKNLSRFFSFHS